MPGISFVEVIIALAFFSLVCGVLLVTQGRSVATGMRAIYEQLVAQALLNRFTELDRKKMTGRPWCSDAEKEKPLEAPAPVGTVFCVSGVPHEHSQAHRYPQLQRDECEAVWMHEGREIRTKLIRFRFDAEVPREE